MATLNVKASLDTAKSHFAEAVREGITVLTSQCGYSRERATSALLRELAKGEDRPTEEQQFEAMKRYGLGIEEASKALIVSLALQRILKAGLNPVDAIQELATKISTSNLLYESSDEDPTSDDVDAPVRPGMWIEPVSTKSQISSSRKKSATTIQRIHPTSSTSSIGGKASKSSKTRNQGRNGGGGISTTGRKRMIDEISPEDKKKNTKNIDEANNNNNKMRTRADSVTEAVDAKIANQTSNGGNEGGAATGSVRSKRVHRMEEQPESGTPATKRRIM